MAKIKRAKKDIACLESLWDFDVEQALTVEPILDVIAKVHHVHFSHLACNTGEEFKFNLRTLPSRSSYRILYLAFHGSPGEIGLADGSHVNLEELSGLMGTKFKGWVVHFGSCDTLSTSTKRLQRFFDGTQTSLLVGYKGYINWVDSAAMDLIILDWLQYFKDLRAMWKRMRKDYPDLIKLNGLTVFPRN
jgi:hypothetical protein